MRVTLTQALDQQVLPSLENQAVFARGDWPSLQKISYLFVSRLGMIRRRQMLVLALRGIERRAKFISQATKLRGEPPLLYLFFQVLAPHHGARPRMRSKIRKELGRVRQAGEEPL